MKFIFMLVTVLTVFALIASFPTMWLVNFLLTDEVLHRIFGGPLTPYKAFWLFFTCHFLFGGRFAYTKDS